jgi:hypothetical protein
MYPQGMNIKLYRSPDAGEGGGAAPAAPAGGDAGAAAGNPNPAPEYVGKADFEAFRNEISGHFQRLSQPRSEAPKESSSKEPRFPNPKDYKFDQDGEYERYERDKNAYFRAENRKLDEEDRKKRETEEGATRTEREHYKRVSEYKKEHPEFDEDSRKAGSMHAEPSVKSAIYASDESAAVVHYLTKNKGLLEDLNEAALTGRESSIPYMIGKIAARIEAESKVAESTARAAEDRPPRQNFRNAAPAKPKERSLADRFNDYNS